MTKKKKMTFTESLKLDLYSCVAFVLILLIFCLGFYFYNN